MVWFLRWQGRGVDANLLLDIFPKSRYSEENQDEITSYSEHKQWFQVMLISPPVITQYELGQIWIEEDRMPRNKRHYSTVST